MVGSDSAPVDAMRSRGFGGAGAVMQQDFRTLTYGEEGGMKLTFNGVYFSGNESCFNVIIGADPEGAPAAAVRGGCFIRGSNLDQWG